MIIYRFLLKFKEIYLFLLSLVIFLSLATPKENILVLLISVIIFFLTVKLILFIYIAILHSTFKKNSNFTFDKEFIEKRILFYTPIFGFLLPIYLLSIYFNFSNIKYFWVIFLIYGIILIEKFIKKLNLSRSFAYFVFISNLILVLTSGFLIFFGLVIIFI
jgi:hypothetical protein